MTATPIVSIIVRTMKGREKYLISTLTNLINQNYLTYEIIIIAQGYNKNDRIINIPHNDRIKIVFCESSGQAYSRNIGIKNAIGEIIAFLDDDICTKNDWLENLVNTYNIKKIDGVGGPIKELFKKYTEFQEKIGWYLLLNPRQFHVSKYGIINSSMNFNNIKGDIFFVSDLPGANMSFRRAVIDQIGFFDEHFHTYGAKEESDYSFRSYKNNFKLVMNLKTEVIHLRAPNIKMNSYSKIHHFGLNQNKTWYIKYAENDIYFFMKNLKPSFSSWIGFTIIRVIEMYIHIIFISRNLSPLWLIKGYMNGYKKCWNLLNDK